KEIQLLHDTLPTARRIAYLSRQEIWGTTEPFLHSATAQYGVEIVPVFPAQPFGEASFAKAFSWMANAGVQAVAARSDGLNNVNTETISALALAHRLPIASTIPGFAATGGLIEYAPNYVVLFRAAAGYVARILNGERPGDLPVQQPTTFDFVVNLKTA